MAKIDLVRLRKRAAMSQRELADRLQVRPSFLSAIENGRSRIPEEKIEKLKEIFEIDSLDEYMIEEPKENVVPPHTHAVEENDSITALLNHFHELAHQRDKSHGASDEDTLSRIEYLTRRNDRLSDRIDDLRDEIDDLRAENLCLKELLVRNGIPLP